MAQRTFVTLVDDVDGNELTRDQGETVRVTLDGAEYQLDLSHKNAQELRDDFGKWLDHARKVGGKRRVGRARTTSDVDNRAVRAWAASNGIELSKRGRIPATVIDQFKGGRELTPLCRIQ
jgi:hypothetical protein